MRKLGNTPECINHFKGKECRPYERKQMPEVWSEKPVAEQDLILMNLGCRIVRQYLEERYNTTVLREQFGVSTHSVHCWAKVYRLQGAEGLVFELPSGEKAQAYKGRAKPDCRREEVPSGVRTSAYRRGSKTLFTGERQYHNRTQNAFRRGPDEKGQIQAGEESDETPLF